MFKSAEMSSEVKNYNQGLKRFLEKCCGQTARKRLEVFFRRQQCHVQPADKWPRGCCACTRTRGFLRAGREEWVLWQYASDRTVSLLHSSCPVHSVFIHQDLEAMVQAEGWQYQGSKAEPAQVFHIEGI